jgi:MFS superfamily sulfate permease-like transporter
VIRLSSDQNGGSVLNSEKFMSAQYSSGDSEPVPVGNPAGFTRYLKYDLVSGFLVFLIALPLCLAISQTSGFPPIAGIFTAIIGAILSTVLSNSELTIKGPAAGMIVIVVGCVQEFGGNGMTDGWSAVDTTAYQATLAVGVAAAILQICFGFFRAGILGEFFPISAVHGMLAAIGVIIGLKQIPYIVGFAGKAKGKPFELMQQLPEIVRDANPAIAVIGLTSVLIMFFWPVVRSKIAALKVVPAPLVVLLVTVPMGMYFDLITTHSYEFGGSTFELGEGFLVKMPDRVFGMFDEITHPDFTALKQPVAWKWVFMFFAIGTLESLLSAKAVDLIDPWKRKANLDRDTVAVGVGNLCASMVGGLPMISEIVRSRANIDNGARTRFANMWHGVFLLVCVALIPTILHRIPVAALGGMLLYTGYRLAHPTEFLHTYQIGREQLAIFVTTLIVVLATDLLIGVAAGIVLKLIIHVWNGVPVRSLFKANLEVQDIEDNTSVILAHESAVFSNWIPLRKQIEQLGPIQRRNVIVDVSNTQLVDHSVMGKLEEMKRDFDQAGLRFEVRGLDELQPVSSSAVAARKRGLLSMSRLTVVTSPAVEVRLQAQLIELGGTGYTAIPCSGAGRLRLQGEREAPVAQRVRIEVVAPHPVIDRIVHWLRVDVMPEFGMTVTVEVVQVVSGEKFSLPGAESDQSASSH